MNIFKRLPLIIVVFLAVLNTAANPLQDFLKIHSRELFQVPIITRSIQYVQQEYYDPSRINPNKMLKDGFYELAQEVPEILPEFNNGTLKFYVGDKSKNIAIHASPVNLRQIIPAIDEAFKFIKDHYNGDVEWNEMQYSFVNGLVKSLDPHSNLLPPQINKEFKTETEGEYGGLGISITMRDKVLTIDTPFPDTPAAKAGLQPNDQILEINSLPTLNMPMTEAVDLMRGRPGTSVTLTIKPENKPVHKVSLKREIIEIKSVEHALVKNDSGQFGLIKIKAFHEDTFKNLENAMRDFKQQGGIKGIILDMRGNPGGLLNQATLVADYFLDKGEIVFTVGASNIPEEIAQATMQSFDVKLPLVVLIDQGSASASEIVAGALKNNNRAVIVGQTSFGKGSVQTLYNMRDGSSLKLTIAQYLTPGKVSIQATGIVPDIYVTPAKINKDFFDIREDKNYAEAQLDSHLKNESLNKVEVPSYALSYLDTEIPGERKSMYSTQINKDEYLVQLSLKILKQAKSIMRAETLTSLKPLIQKEQQEQNALIKKELNQYKIDWNDGQNTASNLNLTFDVLDANNQPANELKAGQKYKAFVTLKNNGTKPIHQVLATIDSYNSLMKNKEFLFGKLNAGEERKQSIEIEVPNELITFFEKVSVQVLTGSQNKDPILKKDYVVQLIEAPTPSFTYTYQVEDGQTSQSKGNKNGVPEKGESVLLKLKITNNGLAPSEKTFLNLKNNEGKYVILKKGRVDLKTLKPGESKDAQLEFLVKNDFKEPDLELDLFISDDTTRYSISDKFKFDLKNPTNTTPKAKDHRVAPAIVSSPQTPNFHKQYNVQAQIKSDEPLLDVILFSKGKKVFYKNFGAQSQQKSFNISQMIQLEDGANPITIQTRRL